MASAVRQQYELFPDPSPRAEPIGPGPPERIDDNLHFGWSWHRYRYCYRTSERLRVLDAGCGTGLTSLGLARLNPGSAVLGLDFSPGSLDLARRRAEAAGIEAVAFREHDLNEPLPEDVGPFDFVVCRRVLGQADDPGRVLENLARVLGPRGLLLVTLPSELGHQVARQMRRAVTALCPPGATLRERAEVGLELFGVLRPDHPIRQHARAVHGARPPDRDRIVADYLSEHERVFVLEEAVALLERAGLRFLYAATGWPWQGDRVFGAEAPEGLKARVATLAEPQRAVLIDALDTTPRADDYRIYACPADFDPRIPSWPDRLHQEPGVIDRLIPHRTGLAEALEPPGPPAAPGVPYRAVTGAVGTLDRGADARLRAIDGRRTCGQIDRALAERSGGPGSAPAVRDAWMALADAGLLLLESPDPRQHVDCQHLGPIVDRLDCPCPRRWLRRCDWHTYCTIDPTRPDDPDRPALDRALDRRGLSRIISCEQCPDYVPGP
ncbi:MAG TPA: class I SAM-dependent methyltransferase [Isosphaeraceae bacterium]|jgi:SAM-dependent methyltransferase